MVTYSKDSYGQRDQLNEWREYVRRRPTDFPQRHRATQKIVAAVPRESCISATWRRSH